MDDAAGLVIATLLMLGGGAFGLMDGSFLAPPTPDAPGGPPTPPPDGEGGPVPLPDLNETAVPASQTVATPSAGG